MDKEFRHYSMADSLLVQLDFALNNIFCAQSSQRAYPADAVDEASEAELTEAELKISQACMRVNHAGEMAAQALYQGQGLTASDPELRQKFYQASMEEVDHLNWCRRRLQELGAEPSKLDPLWYAGSLVMGVGAGLAGDRWNLGFLAETEHQVVRHLEQHLQDLPEADQKSRAIVAQMRHDECNHAKLAEDNGAAVLPKPIQGLMRVTAKVMTRLAARF